MWTRKDAIDYCLSLKNTYEDYPFHDYNWTIMRHKGNKKCLLQFMSIWAAFG